MFEIIQTTLGCAAVIHFLRDSKVCHFEWTPKQTKSIKQTQIVHHASNSVIWPQRPSKSKKLDISIHIMYVNCLHGAYILMAQIKIILLLIWHKFYIFSHLFVFSWRLECMFHKGRVLCSDRQLICSLLYLQSLRYCLVHSSNS